MLTKFNNWSEESSTGRAQSLCVGDEILIPATIGSPEYLLEVISEEPEVAPVPC